jgi:hypothetical protein
MNLSRLRQSLQDIDYSWDKPKTYLVFIPGLSLLIQKIQLANTLPLTNTLNVTVQNHLQVNEQSRRFMNICKWHFRGSVIQIIVSVIARKFFDSSFLSIITVVASYELGNIVFENYKNSVSFHEYDQNGRLKRQEHFRPDLI